MLVDVAIVGGGPAGLSAALVLGRARKSVVLFDAGPPRNAAAERVHGFVTRDGTPPAEFRRIGREQLRPYSVDVRDARVEEITREGASFQVRAGSGEVLARRVLLATGMVDEIPDLPGCRELWGKSVFQCPYCHGWEVRDRRFGAVVQGPEWLEFAIFLKGWTGDVTAFTNAAFPVPAEMQDRLRGAGVRLEERRITGLRDKGGTLAAVELDGGPEIACEALFLKPRQRQTRLVEGLGLALDDKGFVRVDEHRRTSVPGIYAAGDLTTMMQAALPGAAAGAHAAYSMNHELTMELVASGSIR